MKEPTFHPRARSSRGPFESSLVALLVAGSLPSCSSGEPPGGAQAAGASSTATVAGPTATATESTATAAGPTATALGSTTTTLGSTALGSTTTSGAGGMAAASLGAGPTTEGSASTGGSGSTGSAATIPCSETCTDDCFALGGELVAGVCADPTPQCCWMGAPSEPYPPGDPASTPHPETVSVSELQPIEAMPDPLTLMDGTPVTTEQEWRVRRKEMIRLLEDYTYGHMPPPPGNTSAEVVTLEQPGAGGSYTYQMLRLSFGPNGQLEFDLGLFLPTDAEAGPLPVLISLSSSAGSGSLGGAAAAISRGYAVATVPYQALAKDSDAWQTSPFFVAYPDYDWRDIAAWSWGMSRAVDYLATHPGIDRDKIMATGVSRLGQAALHMGAMDQRVALSAPMAGGMALRHSGREMGGGLGQGITEIVDQVSYWFGPLFPEFRNQTPLLPSDQHWLLALTAPRLFIMTNSLSDEYGRAYAAVQTYLEAKPVFEFLGVPDNVGQFFRAGGHGATSEDWDALLDFADQYLMLRPGDRRFDVLPPASDLP